MRVVFWGSPAFAVATLDALLVSAHDVVLVVTQPAKPAGRGRRVAPTPVETRAREAGIPVLAPRRLRGPALLEALREARADVFVVAAYGAILPPDVLAIPPHGAINVHASLLPAHRGASPVTRAIERGDAETGITIMRMEEGLDTGPVLLREATPILPDDTAGGMTERLADLGARLLVTALDGLASGTITESAQDEARATYAPKVTTDEARLDWTRSVAELERAARAFDPWPGAWTTWQGERLRVFRLSPVEETEAAPPAGAEALGEAVAPGTIVALDPAPIVRGVDGLARLDLVQPAGGKRMRGDEWARGRGVAAGQRLGA